MLVNSSPRKTREHKLRVYGDFFFLFLVYSKKKKLIEEGNKSRQRKFWPCLLTGQRSRGWRTLQPAAAAGRSGYFSFLFINSCFENALF